MTAADSLSSSPHSTSTHQSFAAHGGVPDAGHAVAASPHVTPRSDTQSDVCAIERQVGAGVTTEVALGQGWRAEQAGGMSGWAQQAGSISEFTAATPVAPVLWRLSWRRRRQL